MLHHFGGVGSDGVLDGVIVQLVGAKAHDIDLLQHIANLSVGAGRSGYDDGV